MATAWQSNPIRIDGIEIQVHADESGVTFGKLVDGVYSSDLNLTPTQARAIASALNRGADVADAAGGAA